jgi:hypothetical protein
MSVILVALLFNACGAPSHEGMVRYNDQWITQEEYARIANAESPAPASTPAPTPKVIIPVLIISVTSPVSPGANATLVAQTVPGALCTITVRYKSGPGTAEGLKPTPTADSSGRVSWTWKVGTNTTPGTWPIVVTASYGGKAGSQTTQFVVR